MRVAARMADLRVSLTLSGGASLGAFQAGAVAALLVGFGQAREEDSDVRVDAIGGASAGSLVGLLAAFSLLEGADGPRLLSRAWVEEVDLPMLQEGDADGPLSLDGVRDRFPDLLGDAECDPDKAQEGPLTLFVQLTGLRGLTYEIPGVRHDRPAAASTFADWKRFELERRGGVEQIVEPEGTLPARLRDRLGLPSGGVPAAPARSQRGPRGLRGAVGSSTSPRRDSSGTRTAGSSSPSRSAG